MSLVYYLGIPAGLLVVFVFVLYIMEERKRALTKDLLRPSDKHLPILGLAPMLVKLAKNGEVYDWAYRVTKELGFKPWVWYSPDSTEIVITDPKDVKHCFATNFLNYEHTLRKPKFDVVTGEGIFTADGEQWKEHRRLAVSMFTSARLEAMQGVFESRAKKLAEILAKSNGKILDVQALMFSYTFDSICEIAFGIGAGSLENNKLGLQFQNSFDAAQRIATRRFVKPFWEIERKLAKLGIGSGEESELIKDMKIVEDYIYNIIRSRTDEEWDNGKDILCIYKHQKPEVDEKELRDVALNFIIAGRDTTAAVSTWMLLELYRSPETMEKVREEIKNESNVANMHFLQAVFLETLRLQPSVPMDGKTALEEDNLPSGIYVPAGANVNFHPWAFTRNPALFEDPETFKPERWMEDGVCKTPDQYAYPQFNMGPRICLGRVMAANEAKTVVSEIVSEFDIELDPTYERKFHYSAVIQARNGLMMSFTPRSS
eukprot:TRINITY_DN33911_c0_g1_i1.p1 TRINITY_DN33911_c0_g1~~TRINITY_DN33911_c0_g1_i1.p1  ORF type:complete len:487 (+),score=74.41 TRINITY_DN33911_c0_g1_i1:44-1504(+)